jgi:uncharacterized membrane protein YecN with MAPEG domain
MFALPSLITVLSMFVYLVLIINVGRARAKYKIFPPATTGDPNFERVLRVQQNTIEQLIFFLPVLWLFSYYVSPIWGAALGGLWIIGRIIFAWGYYQAPEKRYPGFAITSLTSIVLAIGSLIGIILSFWQVQ